MEGNVYYYGIAFLAVLILVLILIAMVIVVSLKEHRRKKQEEIWLTLIDKKITSAVLRDSDVELVADSPQFESLLTKRRFREQFLFRLVQAEKKFSGSAELQILALFEQYGLKKEAIRKIHSKKDYVIIQGISELRSMDHHDSLPQIQKLALHSNTKVRQEAQLALIHFKGFDGLEFLSKISWNISKWHRIRLIIALNEVKLSDLSKLELWLQSKQPSVVIFSLELMRKYQTLSLYDKAFEILHHPNSDVQIEVIETLVFLENESTVTNLISEFPKLKESVQKVVLYEIAVLNEPEVKNFLKSQFINSPSLLLKLEAAKSLVKLREQPFLETYPLEPEASLEHRQIANHALDLAT